MSTAWYYKDIENRSIKGKWFKFDIFIMFFKLRLSEYLC